MFHELAHYVADPRRLDLEYDAKNFGDTGYARNEIVSELSSAFVCSSLNYQKMIPNNSAYINGWLKVLSDDPKALVQASSRAQRIFDYIIGWVSRTSGMEGTQSPWLSE